MIGNIVDVSGIKVNLFNNSIQVVKQVGPLPRELKNYRRPTKKKIKKFSNKSKRQLLYWLALYGDRLDRIIHLTYPADYPRDIRKAQQDLENFLNWLKRQGVQIYLWIKEYQLRGAVHFHVLIDSVFIKSEDLTAYWNKRLNNPPGTPSTKIEKIKHQNAMNKYVTGYFKKEYQKTIPKGIIGNGRFWGSNIPVKPTDAFILKFDTRRERDRFFKTLDEFYGRLLHEWQDRSGQKYLRSEKSQGFTVHEEGKRVETVILKLVKEIPVRAIEPL